MNTAIKYACREYAYNMNEFMVWNSWIYVYEHEECIFDKGLI